MEKIVALGLNEEKKCTCIYSEASFEELCSNFDAYSKRYASTNWNGSDYFDRTLELESLRPAKNVNLVKLPNPIIVEGTDYDCGHEYNWSFTFDSLVKVESIYEELDVSNWEYYRDEFLENTCSNNYKNPMNLLCDIHTLSRETQGYSSRCYGNCYKCVLESLAWLAKRAIVFKEEKEN